MTHTLHRCGTVESLKDDYVLIAMVNKVNKAQVGHLFSRVAEIMFESGLCNTGSTFLQVNLPMGFDRKEFVERIAGANALLCSFPSKESLRKALTALRREKLGISITVSGLIDEVESMAEELDIRPHTINYSLGVIGNTQRLAEPETMEVTTMCGHALIAGNLVKKGIQEIARGGMTPEGAAMMVAKPCICGIFNLNRAAALMQQQAARM